ncbi:hypothetical protein Tco_0989774 [Tanacetum coccineum]|uniref:Uncharacterized protein n=1 Tax=Tanacetum coccineum TaxID=301880 RepID=A0ABQ5EVQ3_9ASTR
MHLPFSYINSNTLKKVDYVVHLRNSYSQESWISGSVATTTPSPVTTIPLFPLPRRHSLLLVESDFILFEEADAFMPSMTVQISTELMLMYYDPGVTISFSRHSQQYPLPQPNQGDYSPGIQKDLKVVEPQKSSIEYATSYEPKVKLPEVELKELPRISKDNYETFCPTSKERLTLKSMTSSRKKWKKLLDAGLIYPDLGSLGFVRYIVFLKKVRYVRCQERRKMILVPTR